MLDWMTGGLAESWWFRLRGQAAGRTVLGSNSVGGMELISSPKVQTDTVAHPASCLMGTGVSLQGVK